MRSSLTSLLTISQLVETKEDVLQRLDIPEDQARTNHTTIFLSRKFKTFSRYILHI
jgi:hypothetical protein